MVNGEIHLQRCLNDLEKYFFGKKVIVSNFIVDFKETVTKDDFVLIKKKGEKEEKDSNEEEEKQNEDSDEMKETDQ